MTPETLANTVVAPGVRAVNTPGVRAVRIDAVPLHEAEPLLRVAVLGATVAPLPEFVIVRCVPLAIVLLLVSATVPVAPLTPLKSDKLQVCPEEPLMVPPET